MEDEEEYLCPTNGSINERVIDQFVVYGSMTEEQKREYDGNTEEQESSGFRREMMPMLMDHLFVVECKGCLEVAQLAAAGQMAVAQRDGNSKLAAKVMRFAEEVELYRKRRN